MFAHHLHRPSQFQQFYISTTLYFFALALVSIYIPIYLHELDYSLMYIAGWFILCKATHFLSALPIAHLANRTGVKHALSISYGLFFLNAIILLFITDFTWLIPIVAILYGLGGVNFSVAYFSCLSRLGNHKHLGHDLSVINRWYNIAMAAGVLAGGLISQIFSIPLTLTIVAILIGISLIPLMLSPEPIKYNQDLNLRRLPFKKIKRDIIGAFGIKWENSTTNDVWVLFLAIFVFAGTPYAGIGLIVSMGMIIAIVATYFAGRLIDKGKGRRLLRIATPISALIHFGRIFVGTPAVAYGYNVASIAPLVGTNMSFNEGMAERGKEISRYQLLYFAMIESIYGFVSTIIWLTVLLTGLIFNSDKLSLQIIFVIASILILLALTERFKSLRPALKKV